ncbi:Divalent metal cation transporter MntH [Acidipropionibacterium virtanenii]|uniref:Divalent metal cation transporter MntH n=1 Tax=Acidipropionibacterium virtanenii TaxID=2057246 RepID=A0A344UWS8_9ACTN|nr:Divalent metal cation transporter MntH [Acidipropionibacterium virtanenii]
MSDLGDVGAVDRALHRDGGGRRHLWRLLGPGFVAAVAYVDPGNVAANLSAGAEFGYLLVWVLVASNVMAMLVQYLSAKLGLVTGQSLPQIIGERIEHRWARIAFWVQAELVAAATDLAEVIGGAIALNLLFDLPLLAGGVIIGAVSMGLLAIPSRHSQHAFELVIIGMLLVVTIGFTAGLFVSGVSWGDALDGLVPRFEGQRTLVLATSMLGATIMPHAIYMHSALVRDRHGSSEDPARTRRLLSVTRWDVGLSLAIAGSVNIAMLLLAASSLFGVHGIDGIQAAHAAIGHALGPVVALIFAIGLLASGLASTSVGAYAGAEIMKGLLHIRVPLLTRRLVTLIPALVLLATPISPTWALVLSQVLLSMGLPFAIAPLTRLTNDRNLMGRFVNGAPMRVISWAVTGLITVLNLALIWLTLTGAG